MYVLYMSMSEDPLASKSGSTTGSDPLSVVQAREQLPSLLEAAEAGTETVISRRGRPVAVLGPLSLRRPRHTTSLDSLIGSGSGLWGRAGEWVERQRSEWH
jgi:prevent-host-death family protein